MVGFGEWVPDAVRPRFYPDAVTADPNVAVEDFSFQNMAWVDVKVNPDLLNPNGHVPVYLKWLDIDDAVSHGGFLLLCALTVALTRDRRASSAPAYVASDV